MRIYPAIRAQMGDWQYYIVRIRMREVARNLKRQPSEMRNHDISEDGSGQYRDHLLFWPIGQELFAKVARSPLDDAPDRAAMRKSPR